MSNMEAELSDSKKASGLAKKNDEFVKFYVDRYNKTKKEQDGQGILNDIVEVQDNEEEGDIHSMLNKIRESLR